MMPRETVENPRSDLLEVEDLDGQMINCCV